MVEFALVLPLLALLLLLAVDFGRVFFGWVGLQNAARIGANYGALYPNQTSWSAYQAQIAADTAGINCALDAPLPPSFPDGKDLGDRAVVDLTCDFDVITPFISAVTGSPIQLNASSTFAIRSGIVGGSGGGGGGGGGGGVTERTVPDLVGMSLGDARKAWETAGFLGSFDPPSGQDSKIVVGPQAPLPGTVTTPTTAISVSAVNATNCAGTSKLLPKVIGLTVADARTSWQAAGFPPTAFDPELGSGDQVVVTQVETPDATVATCVPITTTIAVTYEPPEEPLCLVPALVGTKADAAQTKWSAAGFETTVIRDGTGNFTISGQSIVQGTAAFCAGTTITVFQ
jgi:hypothetical protein